MPWGSVVPHFQRVLSKSSKTDAASVFLFSIWLLRIVQQINCSFYGYEY